MPKTNFEPNLTKMAEARKAYTANAELQYVLEDLVDFFSKARLDKNMNQLPAGAPDWRRYAHVGTLSPHHIMGVATDTLDNEAIPVEQLQRRLKLAKYEQELNKLAEAFSRPVNNIPARLYNPGIPELYTAASKAPAPATANTKHATGGSMGIAGKLGVLLDLLTYSGETNSNNDAELAAKRGPAYSNKSEYSNLLQQLLQQNNPLP